MIFAVYMLRAYCKIFQGDAGETESITDLDGNERWPVIILTVTLLAVGFFPGVFVNLIQPAFTSFFGK